MKSNEHIEKLIDVDNNKQLNKFADSTENGVGIVVLFSDGEPY
jgi:hypothetical protein